MLLNQPILDSFQEKPVQVGINKQDQDLRDLVPDVVDVNENLAGGWGHVRGNPDNEDSNVDKGNGDDSAPFDFLDCGPVLSNECDSVDDDLHQHLDLEDPEE